MLRRLAPFAALVVAFVLPACGSSDQTSNPGSGGSGGAAGAAGSGPNIEPADFVYVKKSCAYDCPPASCIENTQPYDCQNLRDWRTGVPHADTCGSWDETYPDVVKGQCTVSAASGDSKKFTGPDPDDANATILPDGRRVRPAGKDWVFNEPDLLGGITTGLLAIPSTNYVLTVDTGTNNHAVRVIDTTKVGSGDPVTGYVRFSPPDVLNSGMAFVPPDLVYVATDDGVVQALSLDTTTGAIQRDDTRSLTLADGQGREGQRRPLVRFRRRCIARRLAPGGHVRRPDRRARLRREGGSATFGQQLGKVSLGKRETFGVWFDPADNDHAYVSMWANAKVLELDLTDPALPTVARSFNTGKDPEGIAFLDSRWLAVGNDLGDSLTLVDRVAGTATTLPVDSSETLHGLEPSRAGLRRDRQAAVRRPQRHERGRRLQRGLVEVARRPSRRPACSRPTGGRPASP